MAYIQWTPELDTGIDVIDQQHRQLVAYVNRLVDARKGGNRILVGQVLNDVIDYTRTHFAFEEKLLQEAGYPYFDAHCSVHHRFVEKIETLQAQFQQSEDVSETLERMLSRWLMTHIRSDDAAYAERVKDTMNRISGGGSAGKGGLKERLSKIFKAA